MNKHESILYRFRPRNLLRNAIKLIPKNLRYKAYRRWIKLPIHELEGVRFKIAHRKDELEKAFALLHDAYVAPGYMKPDPSGLRVTKYHALPSTTTIVAMKGDEVIATVSVIRDGPFGFPSDAIVDTSHLRVHGARIAEVSALAVHRDYRQSRGAVLWPILSYMYRYSIRLFGIDNLIIAVHPSHYEFYESLLFFVPLTQRPVDSYAFVNDKPAMCALLNVRDFYKQTLTEYSRAPIGRNLFDYFFEREFACMWYPKRENFKVSDPFLTPDLLSYFFRERTDAFSKLSDSEISILHSLYQDPLYRAVLPACSAKGEELVMRRQAVRHDVKCKGRIVITDQRVLKLGVRNASVSGFQASVSQDLRFGAPVKANIAIAEFKVAEVVCYPVWKDDHKMYGFHILEADEAWTAFIESLDNDLEQNHLEAPFSLMPKAI